jgi:pyrroline-5-carboxylate reductase
MAKIYFIGSGHMSEAIIRALIKNGVYPAKDILVFDIDNDRLSLLQERYGVQPVEQMEQGLNEADLIILGVRPQDDWSHILQCCNNHVRTETIIISLIAGVSIQQLKSHLNGTVTVIRTIPNTLTDTGFGYSGVAVDHDDSDIVRQRDVIRFFHGFGKMEVVSENLLNTFTGVGVVGPNYIYYFYEALVDAGVLAGLSRNTAKTLALENLKGSAAMLELSGKHPRELLDINNSPAGVGIHALYELNNSNFTAALQRSVLAAVKRTTELGK